MKISHIIFKNAGFIFLTVTGFYLIMKLIGLSHIIEFRIFNIVFVIWAINNAIKQNIFKNYNNLYLTNAYIGFTTGAIGVLTVIIAMALYLQLIDDSLIKVLEGSNFWGNNLTIPNIVFAMTIESLASSGISTFILMQYWKKYKIEAHS